jgi:hypothetical protein
LGFYDVHQDCLAGTIHKRKTVRDLLTAFRRLRRGYPRGMRIYVIMDNLPLHKTDVLLTYFSKNTHHAGLDPNILFMAHPDRKPLHRHEEVHTERVGRS